MTLKLSILVVLILWTTTITLAQAPNLDPKTVAKYEEILHKVITYEEFSVERNAICRMWVGFGDRQTGLVLTRNCKVRNKPFSLIYQARGLVLGIVDEDGSVMYDHSEDGEIDFAETRDRKRVYKSIKYGTPKGDEFRAEWQEIFNKRLTSIIEQNPGLLTHADCPVRCSSAVKKPGNEKPATKESSPTVRAMSRDSPLSPGQKKSKSKIATPKLQIMVDARTKWKHFWPRFKRAVIDHDHIILREMMTLDFECNLGEGGDFRTECLKDYENSSGNNRSYQSWSELEEVVRYGRDLRGYKRRYPVFRRDVVDGMPVVFRTITPGGVERGSGDYCIFVFQRGEWFWGGFSYFEIN